MERRMRLSLVVLVVVASVALAAYPDTARIFSVGSKECSDAAAIETALKTVFNTQHVKSPSAAEIKEHMLDGQVDGQLHIFVYVGHGAENTDPLGALVGSDSRGVTAGELADTLASRSGTTIMILDSCLSGDVAQEAARRCVTILTSGGPGQDSTSVRSETFSMHIFRGLRGDADANADGIVTLGELDGYLTARYDNDTRTHMCNASEKGTASVVMARYMDYAVISVTGTGGELIDDPKSQYPLTGAVETGDALKNCNYIRVKEGGRVRVKKMIGCGNEYELWPGLYHLGTLWPIHGSGYAVEILEGKLGITESGRCGEHDHCASLTATAAAYPLALDPDPDAVTYFETTFDAETWATTIRVCSDSTNPLLVTPLTGPMVGESLVLPPGETMLIEFNPYVH
jgi:hypothetical protein